MNEQQTKGTLTKAKGNIEAFLGRLAGDRKQQVKGVAHPVEGDVRHGIGDVQQTIDRRIGPEPTEPEPTEP